MHINILALSSSVALFNCKQSLSDQNTRVYNSSCTCLTMQPHLVPSQTLPQTAYPLTNALDLSDSIQANCKMKQNEISSHNIHWIHSKR